MPFELTVLGANSAYPLPGRFPSSFVLNHREHLFLIDCGEGAQIKMAEFGVKRSRIHHIFISHLHGDHLFGLPGFINSLNLNGKTEPLYITGPTGLERYLDTISEITGARLGFDMQIEEIHGDHYRKVLDLDHLEIFAFPLEHRIPTYAYKFVEKRQLPNIRPQAIERYSLSFDEIRMVKSGKDVLRNGIPIPLSDVLLPPLKRRSFVYCSDTRFSQSITAHLRGTDLLYHEATYMQDLQQKAHDRMHSTAIEAATMAKNGQVGQLLIGHYSSRYKDLNPLLEEARSVFPNTLLATEGQRVAVGNREN